MKRQLICIKWGTKYGPEYVNRLYAMAARNLTPPFTFVCFTDDTTGIRPEVRCEPLPPLDVAMPTGTKGIWPKARLWGPRLADLEGPVLFMDLDVVVTGSLDDFFTFGDPNDTILMRNPVRPLERLGQTSIYRFPVGKLVALQEQFIADPQGVADKYEYEQRFVTRQAPGGIRFWPNRWACHFRFHCTQPLPLNYFRPPRPPKNCRVVIFAGHLFPEHAIAGQWSRHYHPATRLQHLAGLFAANRPEPPIRYLRHYILPSEWVRDAWISDRQASEP